MLLDILIIKKNPSVKKDFRIEFNADSSILKDRLATFDDLAVIEGVYYYEEGIIYLDADISVKILFSCDRCLKPTVCQLKIKFDEIFSRDKSISDFTYEGDSLILDRAIFEAISLSLPTLVVCEDDCKGLCANCGTNLNVTACSCKLCDSDEEEDKVNPFDALKNYLK